MNMKKLLFLGFMFFAGTSYSQTQVWYYNFINGLEEEGRDIVYGNDGFIYVSGIEYTGDNYNVVVIKLNKAGKQEWVYKYEGKNGSADVEEMMYGPDSNIYVCGFNDNATKDDKFMVLCISPEGTLRWDYIFDEAEQYTSHALSLAFDNGTVYAAGDADYNFFVAAINAEDGKQKWIYWFDGGCPYALCDDVANAVCIGDDGTIYAAGYTLSGTTKQLVIASIAPNGKQNWKYLQPALNEGYSIAYDIVFGKDRRIYASCDIGEDIGVICLNTDGVFQWNRNVDGPGPEPYWGETCYDMLYGIDDNIYVVGRTGGRNNEVDTDLDVTVLKINTEGNLDWFYRYEGLYGDYDMGFSIVQTPDTNLHVAAYTCGLLAEANMISIHHKTGRDLFVLRYVGPSISMDVAYAITADEDGYLYLTGYEYGNSAHHDIYVWKINPPRNSDGYYNLEGYGTAGQGKAIIETADTCYVIAGKQGTSNANNTYGMRLIKTDINGDTLWTSYIGGSSEDGANNVIQCKDKGFLLTGYTKSYGAGGKDLYIVKTNQNGIPEWEKYYGFATDEEGFAVAPTTDGGYIVGAVSQKYGNGGDIWLMKINAKGDSLWTKWYGGEKRDEVNEIYPAPDGNFILVGSIGRPAGIGYVTNIYVMKLNAAGETVWTREFGSDNYYENGFDAFVEDDGSILITGYYQWRNWIARLNAGGDTLWTRKYGNDHSIGFTSIAQKKDGNFALTGGCNNQDLIYVVTVDPEGNFLYADTAAWSPGYVYSPTMANASDICSISMGGYMATGSGRISGNSNNWNIILYRKGGDLAHIPVVGIKEIMFPNPHLKTVSIDAYPNPFHHSTTIDFSLEKPEKVGITILDITGRSVYKMTPGKYEQGKHSFTWSPQNLPEGVYFCRIQAGALIFSGKLIYLK
jgi:uncharacterized delta-60 repeat protein